MIILDLSQVMLASILTQLGMSKSKSIEENFCRHMVLNTLRMNKTKFQSEYGEFVVACDGTKYWRKEFFPFYKANRKISQEESSIDWKAIFDVINKIRTEIMEVFPFKSLRLEGAEADDIIAVLSKECYLRGEKTLILSGDKDFKQLQIFKNVKQYDPVQKKFLTEKTPELFLREHIIRGDKGDGIPNILSDDDTFVTNKRQKSITEKKLNSWLYGEPSSLFTGIEARNYHRNETLIDLNKIPEKLKENIIVAYNTPKERNPKLMEYFMENRLKLLMESIGDFI